MNSFAVGGGVNVMTTGWLPGLEDFLQWTHIAVLITWGGMSMRYFMTAPPKDFFPAQAQRCEHRIIDVHNAIFAVNDENVFLEAVEKCAAVLLSLFAEFFGLVWFRRILWKTAIECSARRKGVMRGVWGGRAGRLWLPGGLSIWDVTLRILGEIPGGGTVRAACPFWLVAHWNPQIQ
jgi:hypothetical protein